MKRFQCIAIAGALILTSATYAQNFNYSLNSGFSLNDAIFVYGTPTSTIGTYTATQMFLPTLSGSGTFSVTGLQAGDIWSLIDNYTDVNGAQHVAVAINSADSNSLVGSDFQTAFGVSEANVEAAITLDQGGFGTLTGQSISTSDATFGALFGFVPTYPGTADIMGFSGGSIIGSVSPQAVPSPAGVIALGMGLIGLIAIRRK